MQYKKSEIYPKPELTKKAAFKIMITTLTLAILVTYFTR
jgi:hypothetical protein